MAMIFSLTNQKGGVAKTTTAFALLCYLHTKGYKVCGVDLDPQLNLTSTVQAPTEEPNVFSLLVDEAKAKETIHHVACGDFISGSKALAGIDRVINEVGKQFKLREALDSIKGEYDYIIIDTGPALGTLTANALTAANGVIIPAAASIYSMEGIADLSKTISSIRHYCNPSLRIEGILLTQFKTRTKTSNEIATYIDEMAKNLNTKVFSTRIRDSIAVVESQAEKQSIFSKKSGVAEDYEHFIEELIHG